MVLPAVNRQRGGARRILTGWRDNLGDTSNGRALRATSPGPDLKGWVELIPSKKQLQEAWDWRGGRFRSQGAEFDKGLNH